MRANHAGIPWLQKFLQKVRRFISVSATAFSGVPSTYPDISLSWDSDLRRAWAAKEANRFSSMTDFRLDEIKYWYNEWCELQKEHGLPEPIYCPDTMYDRYLGLGRKYVGELLVYIHFLETQR